VTSEGGETGSEPSLPASPRHFGQLPDLGVPDDFDEPPPEDDWPIDVNDLREALRESEAEIAAGRTFSEDEIRARYGLQRSHTGGSAQADDAGARAEPESSQTTSAAPTKR
jgi:hypothetical protein